MLVITRYPGESVYIETTDGMIRVDFIEHRTSGQIRLGFLAPRAIAIWREEPGGRSRRVSAPQGGDSEPGPS